VSKEQTPLSEHSIVELAEQNPAFRALCNGRPIQTRLLRGALTKLDRVRAMFENTSPPDPEAFRQVAFEFFEIATWTVDTVPRFNSEANIKASLEGAARAGWTLDWILHYRDLLTKPQRGRAITKRQLAVKALEMRLAKPRMSWPQLANQICPCGSTEHSRECSERIRISTIELQKFLSKYQL
jgi:hypothetical protein